MSLGPDRVFVVMPCAGYGSRAGAALPKQYMPLAGQPLVTHTLRAFAAVPGLAGGVLVVAPEDTHMTQVLQQFPSPSFQVCAQGGATRAASVRAGLQDLYAQGASETDWVLVHDAARCLITPELITRVVHACRADAVGGLLALRLPDTLKSERAGRVQSTLSRSDKWLAQTPQMFRLGMLAQALDAHAASATDEASAVEAAGFAPLLVNGASFNFKVTFPEDFALAEAVLRARAQSLASDTGAAP